MSGVLLFTIVVLGGFAGLDVVSFPQAMFSRPIVAATAAGALAGNALAGLLTGVALEMFAMELLPVGAARYPEWGSSSVAGGAIAAIGAQRASVPAGIIVGVICALAAAWLGGIMMHATRRLNVRWSEALQPRLDAGEASVVTTLHRRGLAIDYARAALLTGVALSVALWFPSGFAGRIARGGWLIVPLILTCGGAVAGSAAWRLAAGAPRARATALVLFAAAGLVAAGVF